MGTASRLFLKFQRGAAGTTTMADIVASAVFDLDVTNSTSYDGSSQTWANLIAAPADGAGQTDYDFYLGADGSATATDPTFTGTAGDSDAYFAMDGGDYFTIVGGNTTFLKGLHKAGGEWTFMIAVKTVSGDNEPMFSNIMNNASTQGVILRADTAGVERFVNIISGTSLKFININSTPMVLGDCGLTWTGDIDGLEMQAAFNDESLISAAFTDPAANADPSETFKIGAAGDAGDIAGSGTRVYAAAAFNAVLTNVQKDAVLALWEERHSRSYAN